MKDILIIVLYVLLSLDQNTVCEPNEKATDSGKFFVLFSEKPVWNEIVSGRRFSLNWDLYFEIVVNKTHL